MRRKSTWAVIGLLVLGCLLVVLSSLEAQRPGRRDGARDGAVGRFQAIKVDGDNCYLLDTATGDLYHANLGEAKPYSERPRLAEKAREPRKTPQTKKAEAAKDKGTEKTEFKDKGDTKKEEFKDKAPDPDREKATEKKESKE
jgi:hypothetical protein